MLRLVRKDNESFGYHDSLSHAIAMSVLKRFHSCCINFTIFVLFQGDQMLVLTLDRTSNHVYGTKKPKTKLAANQEKNKVIGKIKSCIVIQFDCYLDVVWIERVKL